MLNRPISNAGALILAAALMACGDPARPLRFPDPSTAKVTGPTDPTATWKIPLDDAGLSLKSDGQFGDGTYSAYANGACGVAAKIFATTQYSNTGDATLQMKYPSRGKCGRRITVTYPDGESETLATFSNLNRLQNTSSGTIIPVGGSGLRRLIVGFNVAGLNNPAPSRCGRLIFGDNGTVGAGTDMLLVTRIDASTWRVQSQGAYANAVLCEDLGATYAMNVDFLVVSSAPLPTS